MATYRLSRNTERSIIDFLTEELLKANPPWKVHVEKVFTRIYGTKDHPGKFPAILVNVSSRPDKRREVGSHSLMKFINVELRLFCEDDGQRLDLCDWLLEKIISGIPYYEYTVADGVISPTPTETGIDPDGRIIILEVTSNRKELINLEGLAKEDKFRHLLGLRCRVSTVGE